MASKKRTSLPKNYKPSEKEKFMSARQREYFQRKLLEWRAELLDESSETLKNMQEEKLAPFISGPGDYTFKFQIKSKGKKMKYSTQTNF